MFTYKEIVLYTRTLQTLTLMIKNGINSYKLMEFLSNIQVYKTLPYIKKKSKNHAGCSGTYPYSADVSMS